MNEIVYYFETEQGAHKTTFYAHSKEDIRNLVFSLTKKHLTDEDIEQCLHSTKNHYPFYA